MQCVAVLLSPFLQTPEHPNAGRQLALSFACAMPRTRMCVRVCAMTRRVGVFRRLRLQSLKSLVAKVEKKQLGGIFGSYATGASLTRDPVAEPKL